MNFGGFYPIFSLWRWKSGFGGPGAQIAIKPTRFLGVLRGPGQPKSAFGWVFTEMVVPGRFLGDFTKKGMEITRFHIFTKTRDFERIGPQKGMEFTRNM